MREKKSLHTEETRFLSLISSLQGGELRVFRVSQLGATDSEEDAFLRSLRRPPSEEQERDLRQRAAASLRELEPQLERLKQSKALPGQVDREVLNRWMAGVRTKLLTGEPGAP